MREKPKSQREAIEQLWMMLIGTNGEGFIPWVKNRFTEIMKRMDHFEKQDEKIEQKFDYFTDHREDTCPTMKILNARDAGENRVIKVSDRRNNYTLAKWQVVLGVGALIIGPSGFIVTLRLLGVL